jgi:hypothetical protein
MNKGSAGLSLFRGVFSRNGWKRLEVPQNCPPIVRPNFEEISPHEHTSNLFATAISSAEGALSYVLRPTSEPRVFGIPNGARVGSPIPARGLYTPRYVRPTNSLRRKSGGTALPRLSAASVTISRNVFMTMKHLCEDVQLEVGARPSVSVYPKKTGASRPILRGPPAKEAMMPCVPSVEQFQVRSRR